MKINVGYGIGKGFRRTRALFELFWENRDEILFLASIKNKVTTEIASFSNHVVTNNLQLLTPTGLTLTFISGGIKVDWTDSNAGTSKTEIWGRDDSGTSALLYTINEGIVTKNDLFTPNFTTRYYKIRAKIGTAYSSYTSEVSIDYLGAEMMPAASVWAASGLTWWNQEHDAGITGDGTKITVATSGTFIGRQGFWEASVNYRIEITTGAGTGQCTHMYKGSDAVGYVYPNTHDVRDYVSGLYGVMFIYFFNFTGTITQLSSKKINWIP